MWPIHERDGIIREEHIVGAYIKMHEGVASGR
jgi:hypothetical protein